ncbi:MAG: succinate dehydrogenase, cytochrome b556 subunit [Anaerolineae bacterium]|nr:succinate dehydrogenase, cytochrome b556 subunit [Anaerolineae bacterium]
MSLNKHKLYPGRGLGMWAFWLHRLTGLAIAGYLLIHILVISTVVGGAENFNAAMKFFKAPLFILLEMGLIAVILIHGLNGIRIILFDLGYGVKNQKQIFIALMLLAIIPFVIGFAVALPHIIGT